MGQFTPLDKTENQRLKAQRRKSTPTMLTNNIDNLKIQEEINEIINAKNDQSSKENVDPDGNEKTDLGKQVVESVDTEENVQSKSREDKVVLRRSLMDKVAQRKKNWDYFEINHPKAISGRLYKFFFE